ncbi:unnamed protein product [Hymenolepis diminuta]|uniref:Nucleotid_trans domain-containing protein n=1 Tax=Hymenolepis diminuta TaxID=6216 RepID=A0A0R3SS77_HYMDI|nr:unnamed protein product [Hymenolepis diminuta]
MGLCRLIRTTLWRRMLKLSSEVRYRRSSAFQPLIHSQAIKRSSVVRSKRMSRVLILLFVTSFCLLLSVTIIGIWIHANLITNTCISDCPHIKKLMVERQHTISPGIKTPLKLIDVALVAGGENAARQVPVLVKSIFYHRLFSQNCRQPRPNFRFHIICSDNTCKSLSVLFDTWKVAGLIKVHFYDIAKYETIVLDLDTLVDGNLINLWDAAGRFESDEIIGLVENQSEWYLSERGKSLWPALGHGFNTGVMLIDLKKMRKMGWNQYWKNVTQLHLKNASHTALADQYLVTAINQNITFLRLETKGLQILHWNSPSKSISSIKTGLGLDTETQKESDKMKHESMTPASLRLQFALKMEQLSNLDGSLFKRNTTLWDNFKTTTYESGIMKFCSLLRLELKFKRRIFPFFFGSNANITGDVSLVSQLTLDRLHRLEEIAAHWEGPMSLAVYITDREAGILAEYLESSSFLISRNNICIHLVFQEGPS